MIEITVRQWPVGRQQIDRLDEKLIQSLLRTPDFSRR
jgi:hypothetical protein